MTAERIDMIRKSEYDELVREHLETRAEIIGLESHAALKVRKLWVELYGVEDDEVVYGISHPPISLDEELVEAKGVFELQELNHKIYREKMEAKLKAAEEALVKANAQETALYVENSQLRIMLRECRPCVAAIGTVELLDCVDQMIGGEVHAG